MDRIKYFLKKEFHYVVEIFEKMNPEYKTHKECFISRAGREGVHLVDEWLVNCQLAVEDENILKALAFLLLVDVLVGAEQLGIGSAHSFFSKNPELNKYLDVSFRSMEEENQKERANVNTH